eukprot:PhM_4_TR9808/c0_g1_i1/m.46558
MPELKPGFNVPFLIHFGAVITVAGWFFTNISGYSLNRTEQMYAMFLPLAAFANLASYHLPQKPAFLQIAAALVAGSIVQNGCMAYDSNKNLDDKMRTTGFCMAFIGLLLTFLVNAVGFRKQRYMSKLVSTVFMSIPSLVAIAGCGIYWYNPVACSYEHRLHLQGLWIAVYNLITVHTNSYEGQNFTFFMASYMLYGLRPFDKLPCDDDKKCRAAVATVFGSLVMLMIIRLIASLINEWNERTKVMKRTLRALIFGGRSQVSIVFLAVAITGGMTFWTKKDVGDKLPDAQEAWTGVLLALVSVFSMFAHIMGCRLSHLCAIGFLTATLSDSVTMFSGKIERDPRSGVLMLIISGVGSVFVPMKFSGVNLSESMHVHRDRSFMGLTMIVAAVMMWSVQNMHLELMILGALAIAGAAYDCSMASSAVLYAVAYFTPAFAPLSGLAVASGAAMPPMPPMVSSSNATSATTTVTLSSDDSSRDGMMLVFLAIVGMLVDFTRSYEAFNDKYVAEEVGNADGASSTSFQPQGSGLNERDHDQPLLHGENQE